MVANKHISKIIIVIMAVAVTLCFLAMSYSDDLTEMLGGTGVRMEYESKLFNTDEFINIDIQMDEDEWNKMLSNAISEEYYVCDVVINGKKLKSVAIRPKGNTSLSAIAMDPDTDRYSLKLEFDHFVDGQTCYGLDKLILNNNYADATNMKEAVIYDMYQYLGADASLYNYASVSVNGEYWGVYLALEGVEESFMLRNFGTQDGELYKPDSMEMGGGNDDNAGFSKPDMDFSNFDFSGFDASGFEGMTPPSGRADFQAGNDNPSDDANTENGASDSSGRPSFDSFPGGSFSFDPNNMPNGNDFEFDADNMPDMGNVDFSGGGFSMGGGGANLNYTDDDLDSYSTIWEGEITGTGKADHRRVVTALKNISEGNDLEQYLDVDNVLKYMAVHTFAVNMDSLSGSMAHNYYLYEYKGQLNIFPWDYNLSFGGMNMGSSGDATEMVNDAIDTPFSGTRFFDALLENEEYLERYHAYLRQLVDEYVYGGRFDEVYARIRSQIDSLVETDPTAFYTYDEYMVAADMLYQTIKLRAESIEGQLNGTIPSTDAGQRQDSTTLVDASMIDVAAMGQFSMGGSSGGGFNGGFGGRFGGSDRESESPNAADSAVANSSGDGLDIEDSSNRQPPSEFPEGFDPGNLPEGFDSSNMPDMSNFNAENMPDMNNYDHFGTSNDNQETAVNSAAENGESISASEDTKRNRSSFSGTPGQLSSQTRTANLILYAVCLSVVIVSMILIKKCNHRR